MHYTDYFESLALRHGNFKFSATLSSRSPTTDYKSVG